MCISKQHWEQQEGAMALAADAATSVPPVETAPPPTHADRDVLEQSTQQQQQEPSSSDALPNDDSDEVVALARAIESSAFSTWKASLAYELDRGVDAVRACVHELQSAFDETSVFIRGDVAWRKQLSAFHDRVNDALQQQLEVLVATLAHTASALAQSVTASFACKDAQAKRAAEWQVKMYEDKLRRTRVSLKKEIDRFTLLEKCLRQEQAHKAKETYDALVLQLTTEHAAKEAALHALLRELRSSYSAMELGNTQLMEALRAARADAERMKKILIKQTQGVGTGASGGSPRKSTGRGSSRFISSSGSGGGASGSVSNIADAYVQSLKQSLATSAQTVESLKKQLAELTSDKEASLRKQRQAEDATYKANDELAKVTQLLSESHTALVASRKATEQVASEKAHWQELFAELQFRTGSNEHEIQAAKQLADTTTEYVASLERQVQAGSRLVLCRDTLADAFTTWCTGASECRDPQALQTIVETFLRDSTTDNPSRSSSSGGRDSGVDLDPVSSREREHAELMIKLRYEFEKRYGDQLNLRLSHERKRVLARIETLCVKQQTDADAAAAVAGTSGRSLRQLKARGGASTGKAVPYRLVYKIVSDAYDHLGFSDWLATDLDFLHGQIETLQAQLAQQRASHAKLEQFAEAQAVVLTKADLLQQEKEFLLAELTNKYYALRAAHDAARQQSGESPESATGAVVRADEVPLTVYGYPQRIELKRLRARPVSASPCLVASSCEADVDRECKESASQLQQCGGVSTKQRPCYARPMSSTGAAPQSRASRQRMVASSTAKPFLVPSPLDGALLEPQQQVEHIRSVLKTELLQLSPPENQLEDGSHLGPDGILQIIQRRRSRR